MRASRAKAIAIALSTIVAAMLFGALIRACIPQSGGLPGDYDAHDHDPRLSKEAATAQPLIAHLARYHMERGRFPTNFSELGIPYRGWWYEALPSGYVLSKKLGDGSHASLPF